MTLELVVLVAVAIWVAVVLVALSLCRAAKLSDEAMHFVVLRNDAGDRDDEAKPSPLSSRSPASPPSRSPASSPSWEVERPLRTLDLEDAASLLGVSPETLLHWEERFGFPSSCPSELRYSQSEVLALLASLDDGASIPAAVAQARERIKRRRSSTPGGLFDHRDGGLAS